MYRRLAADTVRKLLQRFDIDTESAARAMQSMPARSLLALQVAEGGNDEARKTLCERLLKVAKKSRCRDPFWPSNLQRHLCCCGRLPSQDYLPDLVELVVKELENPAEFQNRRMCARWFGLSERWWINLMLRPYELLQSTVDDWYRCGLKHVQKHADCTDS